MKYPLLALIKLYQWTISPLLGPVCKYYPSCSHYGFTAIDRHGAIKGTALTAWRILRCNPWSHGGVDHVPPRKRPRWHEALRAAWRSRSQGPAAASVSPEGGTPPEGGAPAGVSAPDSSSPVAETPSPAQGA
ncbi:membrane protein insertion efficiency factor YidD [Streptomyces sp. NRRL F-5630]|uniref:membrane protein insertion efficiency factor YidD n=1 Tax=Streptomyces sp. NRRL F-5630 TaxID=1463864 RepID=UPI003EBF3562